MEIRVGAEYDGKILRELLQRQLRLSGSFLRHLKFCEDGILLNGEPATVRKILHTGDLLTLAVEDRAPQEKLEPVPLALPLVYEDEDVAVPDKPAGMPTHPSCNHHDDTVANALAYYYREAEIPFVFRPVNRLDRNTSGLLLVARNRIAAARLAGAMQRREIHKQYLAVLDGVPEAPSGTIRTWMRRTRQSVILRENCPEGQGELALTEYRVLCRSGDHALVLASPLTGRTHQLRVHFAGIGAPITGDDLYGTPSGQIGRHALHACTLSFPHPADNRRISLYAPLHEDMRRLTEHFFGREECLALEDLFSVSASVFPEK